MLARLRQITFGHWRCWVAALVHFGLTGLCGVVVMLEGLDRATGENKVEIPAWVVQMAFVALKILLFPLGYLVLVNRSLAIGIAAANSAIVCSSPIWGPKTWRWVKARIAGKGE